MQPVGNDASRLVVKLLFRYRGGRSVGWVIGRLFPFPELLMMRKQLLTLKGLSERQYR